jgi:hypothetical protein
VVMVIPNARLVTRRAPGRLDPAQQARSREGGKDVIDGLRRDRADTTADAPGDLIGGHVPAGADLGQHRNTRRRHAQPGAAQYGKDV